MGCKEENLEIIGKLMQHFCGAHTREGLSTDITFCVERFLKHEDVKDIQLFIEGHGKKVYIFSNAILMVVERTDEVTSKATLRGTIEGTHITQIKCYPLKRTEYCELRTGEGELNKDITIEFKIGDESLSLSFIFSDIVNMTECLEGIFTKILTNIRDEVLSDKIRPMILPSRST